MSARPGYFVAVCGIDGSGKTTQVERAVQHLSYRGEVVKTRQPTDMYRQDQTVREFLDLNTTDPMIVPEIALFAAFDRLRHVREVVNPALADGKAVLTDRYMYTGYAYMSARGSDIDWLRQLYRFLPEPDLTIYLDVPPEVAVTRIVARDGSSRKREELDVERMTAVREAFLEQPWGRSPTYVVVDGTAPADDVTARISGLLASHDPR